MGEYSNDRDYGDVYPAESSKHNQPPSKPARIDFKPWHKPRKHWIRLEQWSRAVSKLIPRLQIVEERPIRYLTLPGDDFLDVWVLKHVCAQKNCKLRFLGFRAPGGDSTNEINFNISSADIMREEAIHRGSVVMLDRIETLAYDNSNAMKEARQYGTFDVINLDICDSLANRQQYYFATLESLIKLQAQRGNEPWLLLITTRATPTDDNADSMNILLDKINNNIDNCDEFEDAIHNKLGIPVTTGKVKLPILDNSEYVQSFALGLSKWLLSTLSSGHPKWLLTLNDIAAYRIAKPKDMDCDPDMLSFVYLIEQDHIAPTSIGSNPPLSGVNECDLALKLVDAHCKLVDVDNLLLKQELRNKIVRKASGIMKNARFSEVEYVKWAKNN